MTSGKQTYGEDVEGWAELADGLCKLKMASDYAKEFSMKFGKYMSLEDRLEIAAMNVRQDGFYWKYWEKLIQKIRGIFNANDVEVRRKRKETLSTQRPLMDKQILKVKKDVKKNDKKKAEKDIGKLLKMDKKQDAKVAACDKSMKMKKGK